MTGFLADFVVVLRLRTVEVGYESVFIEHHLLPVLYPSELARPSSHTARTTVG